MAAQLLPLAERVARSRAALARHDAFVDEQLAAGLDGPVPPGRKSPSDYNVHVPTMEADGAALDRLFGVTP